jgi:recombination protein RecA
VACGAVAHRTGHQSPRLPEPVPGENKVAPPFREAEFDIMYGEGISREGDLIDLAVDRRVIDTTGAWFAFGGERLGQGRENATQFLKEHADVRLAIEDRLRKEPGLVRDADAAVA